MSQMAADVILGEDGLLAGRLPAKILLLNVFLRKDLTRFLVSRTDIACSELGRVGPL